MNDVVSHRYFIVACHVLWRELSYFAALSHNIFKLNFLQQGLHCTPDLLRQELQEAIDNTPDDCEAVLIGYGLCSNGLDRIQARDKPLVVIRAHDCITHLLGSKTKYRNYFDMHPGTYWYSPGWIDTQNQPGPDRYHTTRQYYIDTYGDENAEFLMQHEQSWMHNYANAAYVDLGIGDREKYIQYTRKCAEWLNWACEIIQGDPELLRDFLDGKWDNERMLVVSPRHMIRASLDEATIMTTVPSHECTQMEVESSDT